MSEMPPEPELDPVDEARLAEEFLAGNNWGQPENPPDPDPWST